VEPREGLGRPADRRVGSAPQPLKPNFRTVALPAT
jgi:hypothetical protein